MRLPKHRTDVTSEVVQEVREEIEGDRRRRAEAFRESIDQLCSYVEEAADGDDDLYAITGVLWELLMAIGLKAVELIWARRRQAPNNERVTDAEGRIYHYYKQKDYPLRCVFGEGEVIGSQYVRGKDARSGDELCPQFARMGAWSLGGAFGPRLALECGRMCSLCPFEPAKEHMERYLGCVPSTRALQGIVDELGPVASDLLQEAPCPDGEVLVVQFDGRGLPRIRDEEYQKRCVSHQKGEDAAGRRGRNDSRYLDSKRTTGQNKAKTKEVSVGIIYGLERTDEGEWEPTGDKHYFARMGDRKAVMKHLGEKLAEAEAREEPPDRILFLSDGATDYEDLVDDHLPDRCEHVIDYYHVCEYIWKAVGAMDLEGTDNKKGELDERQRREAYVRLLKDLLCCGEPELVLATLRAEFSRVSKRGPGTKARRERIEDAIEYIEKRTDMMPYDELLAEGLEIGSGAIESAVRQVVELRFDGPGMRWGEGRPNRMLNLVCTRLSSRWDQLADQLRDEASQSRHVRRMTPTGVQEARQMAAAA